MIDAAKNPMNRLYQQLKQQLRLTKPYVQGRLLPSWWDDSIAEAPSGFSEAVLILGRNLGLDAVALRDRGVVKLTDSGAVKFKNASNKEEADVALARHVAVQVARLTLLGVRRPFDGVPDASIVRQTLLAKGHPWVDLASLADYCWDIGIPVIFLPKSSFPSGTLIMHGLAAKVHDRPVIVISWNQKHDGWLVFVLAHELGHIARGHIGTNGVLVDQQIDEESTDKEEREANDFALALICGADSSFTANKWLTGEELAQAASAYGKLNQVDPQHIVLNYTRTLSEKTGKKFWGAGNKALNILGPDDDAPGLLRARLQANLQWDELPDDAAEYVARMIDTSLTQ